MNYPLILDISRHQDNLTTPKKIDLKMAKDKGVVGIIVRASYGFFKDPIFDYIWKQSGDLGMLRGAYMWWNYMQYNAQLQADFFLDILEPEPPDFPPALDIEHAYGTDVPKLPKGASTINSVSTLIRSVKERNGRYPILYCNRDFLKNIAVGHPDEWLNCHLWFSDPGAKPENVYHGRWPKWTLWQFSWSLPGKEYGMESTILDGNYFNGSTADLEKFANKLIIKPPEPAQDLATWAKEIDAWARTKGYNGVKPG